jgi:hypothetical protein
LNIKTKQVPFVSNDDFPDESNMYICSLVEKIIFAMTRRFADELIRQTCADIYFDSPSKSPISLPSLEGSTSKQKQKIENLKKDTIESDALQYQKFPGTIGVKDVFNTILKHERYDFLTNTYMASVPIQDKKKQNRNSNNDSHSNVNLDNKRELFKNKLNNKNNDFMDDSNKNLLKLNTNIKRNFSESTLYKSEKF